MGENALTKSIPLLFFFVFLFTQQALAQLTDDFADGNHSSSPTWSGTTADFVVNGPGRLQLNAPLLANGGGNSYLTLPFSIPDNHNVEWTFYVSHTFSATGTSNGRIYLMSNSANLSAALNGYYLQFGEANANDRVELFRQSGATSTSVCRALNPSIAASFAIRVRVTRTVTGNWEILIDPLGNFDFVSQATGSDNTFTSSSFFGINCRFNNDSFRDDFLYDDISIITTAAPDVTAPQLTTVTGTNASLIHLNFSESMTPSAVDVADFTLNDTVSIATAFWENNNATLSLMLAEPMENGRIQNIDYPALADVAGNVLATGNFNFLYFSPVPVQANDVVINEMYPDPSPSLGLPEFEFVELFNRSNHPFQLEGWQLTDGTTVSTLTARILLPGEYLIVSSNAAANALSPFGAVMGLTTFPSLNNSGDQITLKSATGLSVSSESYNLTSYQNDDKESGGYTLERIDPTDVCTGPLNWKASTDPVGGTPGQKNSVYEIIPDSSGPKVDAVVPKTANSITLFFNEKLSANTTIASGFSIDPVIEVTSVAFTNASQIAVDISFAVNLDSAVNYSLTASNVFDCPGNIIQEEFTTANFKMDMVRPTLSAAIVKSQIEIELEFSEKVSLSSQQISIADYNDEYSLTLSPDEKRVTLLLSNPFVNGKAYQLSIAGISDRYGNTMLDDQRLLRYFQSQPASRHDIVINEIFADPTPAVSLPEFEYVEIFNASNKPFDLVGWTITDGSTVAALSSSMILPEENIILCPLSAVSNFSGFGRVLGLPTLPSLNNSGDMIVLKDNEGRTIDSLRFDTSWYHDGDKQNGGWSVEKINPYDNCRGEENWSASIHELGGTPGHQNSVYEIAIDSAPPKFLSYDVIRPDSVVLTFDKRLSENSAASIISGSLQIAKVSAVNWQRRQISIRFVSPMDSLSSYSLQLDNVSDCSGNLMPIDQRNLLLKLDNIPPRVENIEGVDANGLSVSFSEKIKAGSGNFSVGLQRNVEVKYLDAKNLRLTFDPPLVNGVSYQLIVSAIKDLSDNTITNDTIDFVYFKPMPLTYKDVVISEIFADPTPVVSLPEVEYIELFNRSENPVQLEGWTLADANSKTKLPNFILLPDHYLTITSTTKAYLFKSYGAVIGTSNFPTLANAGEPLALRDSTGFLVDSLYYSDEWYHDSELADGGFALELIDPNNICSEGENWTATEDDRGATPGAENSVMAEKPDLTPPLFVNAIAVSADSILLLFNEKMDKTLPEISRFDFTPTVNISNVSFSDLSKRSVVVKLLEPLFVKTEYKVVLKEWSDCAGNLLTDATSTFGLPEKREDGDIVINEILFNPRPTGVDFIEVLNQSEKYINLKNWKLANVINDTLRNKKELFDKDFILRPSSFAVLTADPNTVKGEYLQANENALLRTSLPSMSDNEGSVAIIDEEGTIVDTVFYSDKQHSPLLKNTEGVSLERIDPTSPSSNKNNWHSASGTSGYATPGLPNSAWRENVFDESIVISPEIFIPETGQPDYAMIAYDLSHAGYVANVKIIDAQGRVVKEVAQNELLGTSGFFKWHGDTNAQRKAPVGTYMIWFEMFDMAGDVKTVKKRVAVAERF